MAWTYEQLFNTLNDGDLNGQDSWTGGANYDVQTTTKYEGAKGIEGVNTNQNIARTITGVTSGTLYVAMRMSAHGAGSGDAAFDLLTSGTDIAVRTQFRGDSDNVVTTDGASTQTLIAGFNSAIFYLFEITLNGDDTYNIRYHDGTSWSSPLTNLDYGDGAGDIDTVRLNSGGDQTMYWDTITPTNPIQETYWEFSMI